MYAPISHVLNQPRALHPSLLDFINYKLIYKLLQRNCTIHKFLILSFLLCRQINDYKCYSVPTPEDLSVFIGKFHSIYPFVTISLSGVKF